MKNKNANKGTPSPARLLTGALALTGVMLVALVWFIFDSYRNDTTGQLHNLRIEELRGTIVHLDEVLTMSARMAAATGEPDWERRYRQFEPQLDAAIKEVMLLTAHSDSAKAAAQTDSANLKLVEMENRSFALVRAGKAGEARAILFTDAYEAQKKIYAGGMATLIQHLKEQLAANQRKKQHETIFSIIAVALCIILLFLAWLSIPAKLKRVNHMLQTEVVEHTRAEQVLRESKEHFHFLDNLGEATCTLADPEQIMAVMSRMLGEHLHASRCAYADVEKDGEQFTILHDYTDGCASTAGNYQLSLFGARAVATLNGGQTLIIRNVEAELLPGEGADMFNAIGIKAIITCPLSKDGTLRAMMAVHQTTPRDWKPGEITIVQEVVERCWATIERRRAEEALRASEAEFHALAEAMPQMVWITRPDGWNIYISQQWMDYTGLTLKESLGHGWNQPFHPEDQQRAWDAWQHATTTAGVYSIESRLRRADGVYRWWLIRGVPQLDATGNVLKWFGTCTDIHDLKLAELEISRANRELRESEEKFRQLAANVADVFYMTSPDMQQMHYVSPAYEQIWGCSVESLYANPREWGEAILPAERAGVFETFSRLATGEPSVSAEFRIARPDGTTRWILGRGSQVRDAAGKVIRITCIASDITERKRFEAQLFQSQKMETVGKLAGGIAHEFNSILTAILGQSELLLGDLPAGSPLARNATEISKAAGRAATLTRQLLAYGRKQFLQPTTLDLNRVIAGMEGMFHHLMGAAVDTQIVPAHDLHAVKADLSQIEQVIVNIAMNARDAMPNGGKLTLETANVSFDPESVGRYPELKPGDYVRLAITDTGGGMNAEVKVRVFEPFFTTKGVGQGTGLGLSTCYGIIKQSGGHISVYSERGRGTTFKIYLPQVESQAKISVPRLDSPDLPRGMETILLVEDDPALREMVATLLRRLGYTVLAAANGVEALVLTKQRDVGYIDLLFTDVVMPHMSGPELADRVRALYPHTRILFTSAYTEHAIVHQGGPTKAAVLLQKPFTPSALAHKVREVLDQPGAPNQCPAQ